MEETKNSIFKNTSNGHSWDRRDRSDGGGGGGRAFVDEMARFFKSIIIF